MPPARNPNDPLQAILVRLGGNVRRARWNRNLTQEQLAELVDLHPRMVQKIEAGQTNILVTTAMRLQAALACPWEELIPPITPRFTKPK